MLDKINLADKLASFDDPWRPRIVGQVNDFHAKVVKLQGAFEWHHHDHEDELFLVLAGRLEMRLRDGSLWLEPGEMVIVPRGVEHCPAAPDGVETHVLLLEPATTVNTGNVRSARTVEQPAKI